MTVPPPVVPSLAEPQNAQNVRPTASEGGVWHAQPPPEDDPDQPTRWGDEADRAAFYTLYEKLMQH